MTIGKRIKQRRLEVGLSVEEVAKRLDKNRATVYRYESEEIEKLPVTVIAPLAKVLECSPAYLMGWTDDPAPIDHGVKETVTDVAFTASGNFEVVRFPDAIKKDDGTILDLRSLSQAEKDDVIRYIEFILSKKEGK